MDKRKIAGYVMAIIGFLFILYTVLNYSLGWNLDVPPAAIGIVFLGAGIAIVKKSNKQN
ncbi:MAG: hypothetical protein WC492_04420 [Candidatus Micrarchaeia archaeon]